MERYWDLLTQDYTFGIITLGTAMLGALCGMLGSFAVLRKQSLLGDAISHAALPGIALAFLWTGSKDTSVLLLGALASGLLGTWWIRSIIEKTPLKTDTALGLILSLFFGFGMVLLTYLQKQPDANQAGLDKFLFGQAATLLRSDVILIGGALVLSSILIAFFWKELKLMTFDGEFSKTLGFQTRNLEILLTFLIVVAIVLGLQTVGVVLMSALLLAPAAAARQWTHSLFYMVVYSAFFGALSGIIGTGISASTQNLSTGPVIVLVASFFVLFSFVFSPKRGLLFREIRLRKNRRDLELFKTLAFMYTIAETHEDPSHPHEIRILNNFRGYTKSSLQQLEQRNWISLQGTQWAMTQEGFSKAATLYDQNPEDE